MVGVSCLTLLLASSLRAAFVSVSVVQFARILALDHYVSFSDLGRRALGRGAGGKRLSGAVCDCRGTSHRHPVSGPRGCRALPPHFPRCSLGAFRRIGAAMARRGGKRLSGAVCGCRGKRTLGAPPTDTL